MQPSARGRHQLQSRTLAPARQGEHLHSLPGIAEGPARPYPAIPRQLPFHAALSRASLAGVDCSSVRPAQGARTLSAKTGDITLDDVVIRTDVDARDISRVIQLHGSLYAQEYGYGFAFESYVSAGLYEFLRTYDPDRSRFWLCEHARSLVGCLCLMDRGETAQLRFFLVHPRYRGLGLGRHLLEEFCSFTQSRGYSSAYLWTTHELAAAAHLYAAYGFRIDEEKTSNAFGKIVVEQKYVKMLSGAALEK